ncbi:chloride channel protein [Peredibacter starrii]|uniref:Chloride channel protein n=1 Tax=Peredibacter starrii TaxID=28202 RepID=A0AAX4HQ29_9BACT|nr:chloride channel protein [Peredibacter starrii]WPU65190.1 chloride channel protein [Peredibacter starrii]
MDRSFLSQKIKNSVSIDDILYWTAAIVLGGVAVLYAKLFMLAEHFAFNLLKEYGWYFGATVPVLFAISWWIVYKFAPEAGGSGIPQVMCALQCEEEKNFPYKAKALVKIRTAMVKIISSLVGVVGGAAVGREGPTIQIGAALFFRVRDLAMKVSGKTFGADVWMITGSAAGVAAAFNTPLGGLVFAIEELAKSHFNRFKSSLLVAVILAGLSSQVFQGSYLYLGIPKVNPFDFKLMPWVILIGILCGSLSTLFAEILFKLTTFRSKVTSVSKHLVLSVIGGLLVVCLAMYVHPMAFGGGKEAITSLLFETSDESSWTLALVRFVSPLISYFSVGAGGIFAPSLAAGGTIGSLFSSFVLPHNHNLVVLLGMIAFLTGVTRAPFTSFVLVLEMTDRHSAIFPMMLVAVIAQATAHLINPISFYERVTENWHHKVSPQS